MFFYPETLPLDIFDGKTRLHIVPNQYDYSVETDFQKKKEFKYRNNNVRIYYSYNLSNGDWGSVDNSLISTSDITLIAKGFQSLLSCESNAFEFTTKTDSDISLPLFSLSVKINDSTASFHFQISDGLYYEYINLDFYSLPIKEIEKYYKIFERWAFDFPVLTEDELKISEEVSF